ncbi:MAG: methionyl-tRNA formyltransferase [Syntrophomonadaceae bacterium]|nr:methionyl-tRNA formyltransferase [Syntrophomonadaceae bacterium]
MRIVFMGTSIFAVPSLETILSSENEIAAVVSQPDRPKGRGQKLSLTPVKAVAESRGITVFQPQSIKSEEAVRQVQEWQPDLIVVVSYGQIIPPAILDYPRYGCINVHASLLPRYRGAAPIQRAIMAGEKISGVSIMFMDKGMDTGDIIRQSKVEIPVHINHGELETILAKEGADLLLTTIRDFEKNTFMRYPQDDSQATYAGRLTKEDERIDWSKPAYVIHNQIRALNPAPGAFARIADLKLKIFTTRIIEDEGSGVIAQILRIDKQGFVVQTGEGTLQVLELQKEGKKRMLAPDFLKGHNLQPGTLLV